MLRQCRHYSLRSRFLIYSITTWISWERFTIFSSTMGSNLDVIKFFVNMNKDEKREKEVRGFVSSLSHEHCESFHARVHPFSSFREQSLQNSVQLWHNYLHSVELIFCTIQKSLSSFFTQCIPAAAAAVTDQALCETQLKSRVWLHKSPFPDMSQFKENLELE